MKSGMIWSTRVVTGEQLLAMGEEFVVYEATSGSTHLLGGAAGQILLNLAQLPADLATLTSQLASQWQTAPDSGFVPAITTILNELHAMDLVEYT